MSGTDEGVRGLRARILRPWHGQRRNASNVISGEPAAQEVLLTGPDIPQIYKANGRTVVVLDTSLPGYPRARPATPGQYQASGAYIVQVGCFEEWYDVFEHVLPIPLHDHTEKSGS